jgi:sugar O-acyltransferase (sialic acid O-acetyltransferase NeuD family)
MKIAIYGCGGFGREVAPLAGEMGADVVFISDDPQEHGELAGHPVVGLDQVPRDYRFVVAVSDGGIRRALSERCRAAGLEAGRVIASTARFRGRSEVGEEAIILDFALLTDNVRVGRGFHASVATAVGHDVVIGDFVTLGPRSGINGNTIVGDGVYVGTGAALRQGAPGKPLVIGAGAVIGMGAVVTKDVPPGVTVVGNPARALERP